MGIRIVENKCIQTPNSMLVIVEAPTPDELKTRETRDKVIVWAREKGFPARGFSALPQTYPVDNEGNTSEEVLLGKIPVAAHRSEFQLSAGMGM